MVTTDTFRSGRGRESVPPHPHDAADIEGVASFIQLKANRILGGTIDGKTIIVSGGVDGVLRSDNYAEGSAGWAILGDGSAEFSDITVRGVIEAGAGSDLPVDYLTAGTIGAEEIILTNSASSIIRSSNYSAGSAGWAVSGGW